MVHIRLVCTIELDSNLGCENRSYYCASVTARKIFVSSFGVAGKASFRTIKLSIHEELYSVHSQRQEWDCV
jgi:hypothetical protein